MKYVLIAWMLSSMGHLEPVQQEVYSTPQGCNYALIDAMAEIDNGTSEAHRVACHNVDANGQRVMFSGDVEVISGYGSVRLIPSHRIIQEIKID